MEYTARITRVSKSTRTIHIDELDPMVESVFGPQDSEIISLDGDHPVRATIPNLHTLVGKRIKFDADFSFDCTPTIHSISVI